MDMMVAIIMMAAAVSLVAVCWLVHYCSKNREDVQKSMERANTITDTAGKMTDVLVKALPGNQFVLLIDKIIAYAKIGVQAAEQMAKSGQISADARRETARNYLLSVLKTAGITVTPEIETAINGAVECAVASLPKSNLLEAETAKS